jgi:iron-sulfur cluster assembly protein
MISVTKPAAEKILQHLQKRGRGLGIRVGVRTTGCSGLAYTLEYLDNPGALRPISYESNGVTVFVDTKDAVYLEGMTLDYQKKGLNEGFEFINPNELDRCGCGESFRV